MWGERASWPLALEIRYNTQTDNRRIATVIAAMWKQALGAQVTLGAASAAARTMSGILSKPLVQSV